MCFSMTSVAWTYSAYYRSNREVSHRELKEDIQFMVLGLYFLTAVCCLVPRYMSLTLFVVYFLKFFIGPIVVGGIAVIHIGLLLLYISVALKPALRGTVNWCGGKALYYIFFAYVNFFLFMNLGGNPKKEMYFRYGIIYIENILLSVILLVFKWDLLYLDIFLGVWLPLMLHTILLHLFYRYFHPKTGKYKDVNCTKTLLCGLV